jgi:DNA-binding IclR family transcriptional regulator
VNSDPLICPIGFFLLTSEYSSPFEPSPGTDMPASGDKYFFISTLAKGLRVMELLAEKEELTVTAVARHLGYNRAGSHRFLATLRELGYVDKGADDRYFLTFKLLELGMKAVNRFEIRRVARSYMHELSLAFKETVNLGYFNGKNILHLDKIDSTEILRMDTPIGSQAPAYCTALGKAILAYQSHGDLSAYLNRVKLKTHGPNTLTSKRQLRRNLDEIRARGFAVDNEEMAAGLRCVAAPVFDHTGSAFYAISLSGPSLRLTHARIEQIHPLLQDVCNRLSRKLGNRNAPESTHIESATIAKGEKKDEQEKTVTD